MERIFYPDEIRPVQQVPGLPEKTDVNDKELTMAKMLIEQLSAPFEPEKYTDEYRARLMDLIQHKIAGEDVTVAPAQQRTNVLDLMAALQASLEAVKLPPDAPGSLDRGTPAAGTDRASKEDAAEEEAGQGGKTARKRKGKSSSKSTVS